VPPEKQDPALIDMTFPDKWSVTFHFAKPTPWAHFPLSFSMTPLGTGQLVQPAHFMKQFHPAFGDPEKVKGKTKNELFKMISLGGKAYVDRKFELNLEESIDLIKAAEGIPILAHPGIYEVSDRTKFVEMCIDAGIGGIEVEYTYSKNRPYVGTEKEEWAMKFLPDFYKKIANKYDLIKSGGSDYHGGKKNIEIGEANVPDSYLKYFL